MKTLINLQMFAAQENLTDSAAIAVKSREIDFVTSFSKNIDALLDVMQITRKIKKPNGSTLKTKKAKGTLQDGAVAEGDIIPLSKYTVEEKAYETISLEKYGKAVSIEAIAEHGYDVAVTMTDDEFKADLQTLVKDKFYTMLKSGSLKSTEDTWQMAIAMSIGRVKDKFKKINRTATGVAVWVNTLDVYKYVGTANVTIQTTFGFEYIKNFMGADVVFLSSEVAEGTVIATPLNNIVCYFVDAGDSEFTRAGLSYTTDNETGLIGFHSEADYSRATSNEYALMGIRLFAEYLDAVAVLTVKTA